MTSQNDSPRPWPRLRRDDRVRIVSPASFPDETDLERLEAKLASWGLVVERGKHVLDQWGYMAGRDEARIDDLNSAFRDPNVRAVFTSRGGAGAYRIVEGIDFDSIREDPKPLVGFSDITYLHMAIWRECKVESIHGAVMGDAANSSLKRLLMETVPVVAHRDPSAYSASVRFDGIASGRLVGGHLSTLAHMAGAGLPSLRGAILLLEDKRDMGLGRVDRQLTQLRQAGALDSLAGVALGIFSRFDGYEDRGWTLIDVLNDHLAPLGVPVVGGLKVGHNGFGADGKPDQICLKIGSMATIDAAAGTLESGI